MRQAVNLKPSGPLANWRIFHMDNGAVRRSPGDFLPRRADLPVWDHVHRKFLLPPASRMTKTPMWTPVYLQSEASWTWIIARGSFRSYFRLSASLWRRSSLPTFSLRLNASSLGFLRCPRTWTAGTMHLTAPQVGGGSVIEASAAPATKLVSANILGKLRIRSAPCHKILLCSGYRDERPRDIGSKTRRHAVCNGIFSAFLPKVRF